MVNKWVTKVIFFNLLFLFGTIFGATFKPPSDGVQVDVELQWNSVYENTPFTATISVTHDEGNVLDPKSFEINGEKISSRFIKNVRFSPSSPLIISMYEIDFTGLPRGLQTLPPISVTLGGKKYSSSPTGFEVKSLVPGNNTPNNTPPGSSMTGNKGAPYLKLEAILGTQTTLYPGQKTTFGYRYLFNTDIDLNEETLPLLESKGFKKIGDKQVEEGDLQGVSVRQVTQKVEAEKPGDYSFGPSRITGYAYTLKRSGEKQYINQLLKAEIPIITVKVASFPSDGKPPSFSGALGSFRMEAKILTSPPVHVGDQISIEVKVFGKGDFDTVKAPDLCCQPGFSGFFKTSDLPPTSQTTENSKTFVIDIIPLNSDITSIPPISFSFFDPGTGKYKELLTEGFPFTILKQEVPSPPTREKLSGVLERVSLPAAVYVSTFPSFPLPLSFVFFSFSALAVLAVNISFFREKSKPKDPLAYARALFSKAEVKQSSPEFYELAYSAIRERIAVERSLKAITDLRELLQEIEVKRFSSDADFQIDEWIKKCRRYF